jgi:hypothetical protein
VCSEVPAGTVRSPGTGGRPLPLPSESRATKEEAEGEVDVEASAARPGCPRRSSGFVPGRCAEISMTSRRAARRPWAASEYVMCSEEGWVCAAGGPLGRLRAARSAS